MIYLLLAAVLAAAIFLTWLAQMALANPYPSRMETSLSVGLGLVAVLLITLFVLYAKAVTL